MVTVPLSYALSCFFLLRLSGKQLPFHSEGDTSKISFALCPLVDTLVGTEAPFTGVNPHTSSCKQGTGVELMLFLYNPIYQLLLFTPRLELILNVVGLRW